MIWKTFRWSFLLTVIGLIGGFFLGFRDGAGFSGAVTAFALVAILTILEVSLSFDNAVVNATILVRMSDFWQKIFLTIGIAIAVFGMRLVFPLLVVGLTAKLGPIEAFDLALNHPDEYHHQLDLAHPAIAAFGGMFLLFIFLDFAFDADEKEHRWLAHIERALSKVANLGQFEIVAALVLLLIAATTLTTAEPHQSASVVLISGLLGALTYMVVKNLGDYFESHMEEETEHLVEASAPAKRKGGPNGLVRATGKAGFFLFLYLEVIDASFSFDGVIGAFAITSDIFIIAIGLGVGAMYIRSLTVYLVRKGTLSEYVYLEHGAMWAIGALAIILLITIRYEVPEIVTGLIGVGFIAAALITSVMRNRREGASGDSEDSEKVTV
ncbi:MAG: DUF475 domain-containing protein [Micromonosporaceae bacterium]